MYEQLPKDPFETISQQVDDLAGFAEFASMLEDAINAVEPGEHREKLKINAVEHLSQLSDILCDGRQVICRGNYYAPTIDQYGHVIGHKSIEQDQMVATSQGIRIIPISDESGKEREVLGHSLIIDTKSYYNWLDDTKIVYRIFAPVKTTTLELLDKETQYTSMNLVTELEGDPTAEEIDVVLAGGDAVDFPELSRVFESAVDDEVPQELLDLYTLYLDDMTRLKGEELAIIAPVIAIRESIDLVSFEYPKNPFVGVVLGFCLDNEIAFDDDKSQNFSGNKQGLYLALATPRYEAGVVLVPTRYIEAYESVK